MTDLFKDRLAQRGLLIMAHRGFWGGNIIQNTRQASLLALEAGADVVEIDVCVSKDNKYYLFHDGAEKQLLGLDRHFSKWASQELDQTSYLNTLGQPSGYYPETLEAFLDWLPQGALVNIDRSWAYWSDPTFFDLLKASGKADQLVLKSPVKDEKLLEHLANYSEGIAFMPIVYNVNDIYKVLTYPQINLIGIEWIIKSREQALAHLEYFDDFRQAGFILMANAENLGESFNLFAKLDDDAAVLGEPEAVWGQMYDWGFDMIQTDWPNFLASYRQNNLSKRDRPHYAELVEDVRDYQGPVDPSLLKPLIGQHFQDIPAFENILNTLNHRQQNRAFSLLDEQVAQQTTLSIEAARLKAETYLTGEKHLFALEQLKHILTLTPFDRQALVLSVVVNKAIGQDEAAGETYSVLKQQHPNLAQTLSDWLAFIDRYLTYENPSFDLSSVENLDAIAIYGFGLSSEGAVLPILKERLDTALGLLERFPSAKVIVSGGAVSTPFNEAEAMRAYLLEAGLESEQILLEPFAKDSIGNSLLIADIIEEQSINSVVVVTSTSHLPRAWMSMVAVMKQRQLDHVKVYGAGGDTAQISLRLGILASEARKSYNTIFRSAALYERHDF